MTLTRRDFIQGSVAATALGLLAACGVRGQRQSGDQAPLGTPTGDLAIANWSEYIDVDEDSGERPTIEQFERETGIKVNYREVIEDNDPFWGTIREPLSRGRTIPWDIIVVTDWLVGRMERLGYLEELDRSRLTTVDQHLDEVYRGEQDTPLFSVPWQAGITGIGYNPELTGRPITSFGDLFDPKFKGKVGMLSDMRDMVHLTLLWMGVDPAKATTDDVEAANKKLMEQRDAGIVRDYYESYTDSFASGDLALTIAYSGDVFQLQYDNPDLRFVVPKEGGVLWVDSMAIPKGAEHAADAHEWMDFVYTPEIAAQIAAFIQFIPPVPAAQEVLRRRAADASGEDREELLAVADSPLVFPTDDMRDRLHRYRALTEEEERTWEELFAPIVEG